MSKQTKQIFLYDREMGDAHPPENLVEHIKWLQGLLEKVPPEFRDVALVEMGTVSYDSELEYTVSYRRPKTSEDLEQEAREAIECAERRATRELALLKELQKKYPTTE